MNTDNTCLVYRNHYFQKAKENMIATGNEVLKLYFYIIHTQSQDDILSFEW